jgi:hypothetical protein
LDPVYTVPLDDDALERAYDYTITTFIPCVEEQGFEITDVVSKETFMADPSMTPTYDGDALERQLVEAIDAGKYQDFSDFWAVCPRGPGSDELSGLTD